MINYETHRLANGLRVIAHPNQSSQLAAFNLMYDVGARDESPEKTGFAHLFEHLMFGGSVNIPDYDAVAQIMGAENNAFTNNDITNYYLTFPANQLEKAFWLESDRMLQLDFSERSLEVQRQVVIEEFKQRYLNQPYGDVWLKLRPLAYKKHPYQWATIGKEISHIENATLADVEAFFYRHYRPDNAVLCVSGPYEPALIFALAEKWFGGIPASGRPPRVLPAEPKQLAQRREITSAPVPVDALYMAFHMPAKGLPAYFATDLLSDVLSRGKSSRLYRRLVKEQALFSQVNAYISGDADPGLLLINGQLVKGVKMADAEAAVWTELERLQQELVAEEELQKNLNQIESSLLFSETQGLNVAMSLCLHTLLGNTAAINSDFENYQAVTPRILQAQACEIFKPQNASILEYYAQS
ncbi:MAG: M16 family metallopeptidase [Bacteroidia bacterium]